MADKTIGDFIPARNRLGHYGVYILRHKDKNFTGLLAGIGFEKGRGSTSSFFDVKQILGLVNLSTNEKLNVVKDITEEYWNAKIEARAKAAKKEADEEKASKKAAAKEEKSKDKEA